MNNVELFLSFMVLILGLGLCVTMAHVWKLTIIVGHWLHEEAIEKGMKKQARIDALKPNQGRETQ